MARNKNALDIPLFDLQRNLLHEEIQSLKNVAMIHLSASFYKRDNIVGRSRVIWAKIKEYDLTPYIDEWKSLIKEVETILHRSLVFPSNEIQKQICNINNFVGMQIYNHFSKCTTAKEYTFFLTNFVFTSQGTINTYKTVIRILDQDYIKNGLKFSIACKYFMGEERIKMYFSKLSKPDIDSLKECRILNTNSYVPYYYWNCKINGIKLEISKDLILESDSSIFNEDDTICCILFSWAINFANEIAVQYLWENLTIPSKAKMAANLNCASRKIDRFGIHNISIYILQNTTNIWIQWSEGQFQSFFEKVLNDCRWHNKHFAKLIEYMQSKMNCYPLLIVPKVTSAINQSMNTDEERKTYWEILRDCVLITPLERYVDEEEFCQIIDDHANNILFPVIYEKNFELLKHICKFYKLKSYSLSFLDNSKYLLSIAVANGSFDFIDIFLQELSNSEEKLAILKERFEKKHALAICKTLIGNENEWEKLNKFMDWFSSKFSIDKANELKSSLLYEFEASEGTELKYTNTPEMDIDLSKLNINE